MDIFGKTRIVLTMVVAAFGLGVISCIPLGKDWTLGSMSAAAKDQIMLVRKEPPSFGFQRLMTQSQELHDLGIFISKHGLPDFLAETGTPERRYFILYFLKERHAFVCRSRAGNLREVEFAGPYPVTEKEFRLLDEFRRDPLHRPPKF